MLQENGYSIRRVRSRAAGVLTAALISLFPAAANATMGTEGFRVTRADVVAAAAHTPRRSSRTALRASAVRTPALRAPALRAPVLRTSAPASRAPASAGADATLIAAHEWADYKARFLAPDGRLIDRENRGISHSEGQGYGMILAMHAGDREAFDRIWGFTRRALQIRGDSLLAWRYDPATTPRVTDINNASDGDILVAYALLRAAVKWNAADYAKAGDDIVQAIGEQLIGWDNGKPILKPGAAGFDRIEGNRGPVVNLSYYFYAAFDLFAVVQPRFPWAELAAHGRELTAKARFGHRNLVPDWVSVSRGDLTIARGFAKRASYDAVRIPLYMAYASMTGFDMSAQDAAWNRNGSGAPKARDLITDVAEEMNDPGYRMVAALSACSTRRAPIPAHLQSYRSTTYFASSLHMLGLVAARKAGLCDNASTAVMIGSRTAR